MEQAYRDLQVDLWIAIRRLTDGSLCPMPGSARPSEYACCRAVDAFEAQAPVWSAANPVVKIIKITMCAKNLF